MSERFWIVGGEYRDIRFDALVPGSEQLHGPFPSYDEALASWQRLARYSAGAALERLTIVGERPA